MEGHTTPRTRDTDREREFLSVASRFTASSAFAEHCVRRLAQGERDFGDRWTRTGMRGFVRELAEEAADLGAWAALADQALDTDTSLQPRIGDFRVWLLQVARAGAEAYHTVTVLQRALELAERDQTDG